MPKRKITEEALLQVATDVFAEKGYHNAQVTDIHQRAGIGRGTFYLYFKSKEEVFNRVLESHLRPIRAFLLLPPEMLANFAQRGVKSRHFEIAVQIVEIALDNRSAALLFLREALVAGPEFARKVDEFFRDGAEHLARVLEILIERELLEPVEPLALSLILLGATKEMLMHELMRPTGRPAEELVGDMLGILLDGVAGPELR